MWYHSFRFASRSRTSYGHISYITVVVSHNWSRDIAADLRMSSEVVIHPKARFPLPELTARVDRWLVSITRQHGTCWRAHVFTSRVDRPEMETGHPSTRAVNSGSGNRASTHSSDRLYAEVVCTISTHVTSVHYMSHVLHSTPYHSCIMPCVRHHSYVLQLVIFQKSALCCQHRLLFTF